MKNFYNFLRHIQRLNFCIMKYAFKELVCIFKGDHLAPSFNPETMSTYLNNLKEGKTLAPLPMGAYEYDCCVEYLKKLRTKLVSSRKDFSQIVVTFDEIDTCQTVIPPLEDCLEMVYKEVGFKLVDESIETFSCVYTFESLFYQKKE